MGWGLQDILNPPTPLMPANGSVSPRGDSLSFGKAFSDTLNSMLRAGTTRAVELLRSTPAGQQVKQEFVRQEVAQFFRSPAAWALGLIVIVVAVAALRR